MTDRGAAPAPGPGPAPVADRRGWLRLAGLLGVVSVLSLAVTFATRDRDDPRPGVRTGAGAWTAEPYRGLGAWIDVFDYVPGLAEPSNPTPMQPADLAPMRAFGVRTLFLQAATTSAGTGVVDEALVGRFLVAAHEAGMAVVAWYLPFLEDLDSDLARLRAIRDFSFDGHRFDGLAVDIEWNGVRDPGVRTQRLVQLSRQADELAGGEPLGAIVMPPVQIEDVNPAFWPGFPWAELAGIYDVWLPMSYWTFRAAPWDDPSTYTEENVRRVEQHVGVGPDRVHVVVGVADRATEDDMRDFMGAVAATGVAGWSAYDFRTLTIGGMAALDPDR